MSELTMREILAEKLAMDLKIEQAISDFCDKTGLKLNHICLASDAIATGRSVRPGQRIMSIVIGDTNHNVAIV